MILTVRKLDGRRPGRSQTVVRYGIFDARGRQLGTCQTGLFDSAAVACIDAEATALRWAASERLVEDLSEARALIEELFEAVSDGDLPAALADRVYDRLAAIDAALELAAPIGTLRLPLEISA